MNTLLLDRTEWDLVLDIYGNIAMASRPYAIAQDAASALRTFQGEVYYDTALGIPYFNSVLGHIPPLALLKAYWIKAALTVPGVTSAAASVQSIINRQVIGQVQITDNSGTVAIVPVGG
jgi:hypothetical protein